MVALSSCVQLPTATAHAQAMNPPYLSQMPSVDRVMHKVQGADAEETLAKPLGTILMLERVIEDLAWGLER
jgi:hypothetical protein